MIPAARRRRRRVVGVLLGGLLAAASSAAHEARPAYLEIREVAPGQVSLLWRTPVLSGMRLPVVLKIPDDVRDLREPLVQELADSRVERHWLDAGPNGLAGRRIEFVGLPLTITDVLVRVELRDGRTWTTVARPSQPWIEIAPPRSPLAVSGSYALQGSRHILLGAEHLLFLLGFLLVVKERRQVPQAVTALIVGNSLALVLATLAAVDVPTVPLDAAFALAILYLGAEIARSWRGEAGFAVRHPSAVAFALGLLCGFGFASALSGAGLPRAELPLALLGFNLGVELAQLAVVALVLLLDRALRRLAIRWPGWLQALPGYTVGSLGAFWAIQRVAVLLTRP